MNKKVFIGLVALMLSTAAFAQGKVVADISNVRNDKGVCKVCLFNNATAFSGEGGSAYACIDVQVRNRTAAATLDNIAPGAYAIMVFHDANNNGKMDKNFLGIPNEGYGASQNKLPFAAAPNFNDNKFVVANGAVVNLKMKLRNL